MLTVCLFVCLFFFFALRPSVDQYIGTTPALSHPMEASLILRLTAMSPSSSRSVWGRLSRDGTKVSMECASVRRDASRFLLSLDTEPMVLEQRFLRTPGLSLTWSALPSRAQPREIYDLDKIKVFPSGFSKASAPWSLDANSIPFVDVHLIFSSKRNFPPICIAHKGQTTRTAFATH
jgi:hypothetical protein